MFRNYKTLSLIFNKVIIEKMKKVKQLLLQHHYTKSNRSEPILTAHFSCVEEIMAMKYCWKSIKTAALIWLVVESMWDLACELWDVYGEIMRYYIRNGESQAMTRWEILSYPPELGLLVYP